MPVKIVG